MVEVIESYKLSYGQWGIFLFACASIREVGMAIDKFVRRLTLNFIHTVCKPKRNVGKPMLSFIKWFIQFVQRNHESVSIDWKSWTWSLYTQTDCWYINTKVYKMTLTTRADVWTSNFPPLRLKTPLLHKPPLSASHFSTPQTAHPLCIFLWIVKNLLNPILHGV